MRPTVAAGARLVFGTKFKQGIRFKLRLNLLLSVAIIYR